MKKHEVRKPDIRNIIVKRALKTNTNKTTIDRTKSIKNLLSATSKDLKTPTKHLDIVHKTRPTKISAINNTTIPIKSDLDSLEEFTPIEKEALEKCLPQFGLRSAGFLRPKSAVTAFQSKEPTTGASSISASKLAQICPPILEVNSGIFKKNQINEDAKSPHPACFGPKLKLLQLSLNDSNASYVLKNKPSQESSIEFYIIGDEIGKGAYAIVKEGFHRDTHKKVAIKVYDKLSLLEPSKKKNVQRETRILYKLNHPNIVKLYETIETENAINLIQEYIGGLSLHDYIRRCPGRKLQETDAKPIFKQIMEAVEYFHSRNVSHRDIKLENILIDTSDQVKLIDFGFAIFLPEVKKIKAFCGTPSYMAPEIVMKKEYHGQPADIWACGILLYALLSGEFPFRAAHHGDLYIQIQRCYFVIPETISEDAKQLLKKMLNFDPALRVTAKSVLADPWFEC